MFDEIIQTLLSGRDVDKMGTAEAKRIVREFWLRVELKTLGAKNGRSIEYRATRALKRAGLECLA